jgi:hypothetical protein
LAKEIICRLRKAHLLEKNPRQVVALLDDEFALQREKITLQLQLGLIAFQMEREAHAILLQSILPEAG